MNDILWLVRKTLNNTFRKKSSWLVYVGLPILGVLLSMLLYNSNNNGVLHVGIANQDGNEAITQDAVRFVEGLNQI